MCADRSEIRILDSTEEADAVSKLLEGKLYEFNVGATGAADGKAFCFTARDDRGEIVGGVAGYTWGGCCDIKELWVAEEFRGRGLGRALVGAAEREAMHRNCRQVVLSTHSFQAPEFYARLGYVEVARVDGHPTGHANIFLAKLLEQGSPASVPAEGGSGAA